MQSKIPRPSRFSDRFNHWAIRHGFPAALWVAPRLPRWLLFALARFIITVVMFFHYKPKRAIASNLARILDAAPHSPQVKAASRQMLYNLAYYWADFFRFAQLPGERMLEMVDRMAGREDVEAAQALGKGVVLITAHLGNWELGALLLQPLGQRVSVVYVPDEFADVERFRSLLRRMHGVDEIPIHAADAFASLPVLRALRENRIVALQGDRDFNDRGEMVNFIGAPAPFPLGPFWLARISGAPLLPAFLTYTSAHRFEVEIGPPIVVPATANREADVRRGLDRWVSVLEAAVRRWPTQWYTFFDYWPVSAPGGAAAVGAPTAERSQEAI